MKLYLDKNQLTKIDLQITTNNLFTECKKCKNLFAVGNFENFSKEIKNMLENKLIYEGIEECGSVELNYFFECPVCLVKRKVPLEIKLMNEKTILLFDAKINQNAERLAKSVRLFKKNLAKMKKDRR